MQFTVQSKVVDPDVLSDPDPSSISLPLKSNIHEKKKTSNCIGSDNRDVERLFSSILVLSAFSHN